MATLATSHNAKSIDQRQNLLLSGSVWQAIIFMGAPTLVTMFMLGLASFADIWVAGQISADAQAAIGLGGQVWFFLMILTIGLSIGTTALVSRFIGSKDTQSAAEAARQSIWLALLFGPASALVGLLTCRYALSLLGASGSVYEMSWDYLKFDLAAQIPCTLLWIANAVFRASGDSKTPLATIGLQTVLVVLLNITFCLGPAHLGTAGIGLSWLISETIAAAVALSLLARSRFGACLNLKSLLASGPSVFWFVRLMGIGMPACVQQFATAAGNLALFFIFAQTANPTSSQATWAIGLRLEEMVALMPIYALSASISTIVGQNLGAKQAKRAAAISWQAGLMGAALMIICGACLYIFAQPLSHSLTQDKNVYTYLSQYLHMLILPEPFAAIWIILVGAMNGAGYTRWPMVASIASIYLFKLPLAWYLTVAVQMGPTGAFTSIVLTSIVVGCLAIWRFKTGSWAFQSV